MTGRDKGFVRRWVLKWECQKKGERARKGCEECVAAGRRGQTADDDAAPERMKTHPKLVVSMPIWDDFAAEENVYLFLRQTARSKNNHSS